jgi:hypothetical protein
MNALVLCIFIHKCQKTKLNKPTIPNTSTEEGTETMTTLATKQPTNESAKQNKSGEKGRSRSISPLSTGMPLLQRQCACGGGCPRCKKQELGIQTKLKISEPGDKYEQEADRIADEVMRMPEPSVQRQVLQRQQAVSSGSPPQQQAEHTNNLDDPEIERLRNALCLGVEVNQGATRCEFSDRERRYVSFARYAARSLTARTLMAMSSGDRYMSTLARRIFHISDVNIPVMIATIERILGALRTVPVVCGTCADAVCNRGSVAAYVPDDLGSIVICPFFFVNNPNQMRRTMIHEAGHVVGIDDVPTGQAYVHPPYCTESDNAECVDPCRMAGGDLLRNVDAWARFIECAALSY